MKLELKHLAPYLPYGLKMIFEGKGGRILEVTGLRVAGISEKTSNLLYFNSISETLSCGYFKPILRPILDLCNYFDYLYEVSEDKNIKDFLDESFLQDKGISSWEELVFTEVNYIPYGTLQVLFEYHFDVFGLIEQGLAISIHDVEQVIA